MYLFCTKPNINNFLHIALFIKVLGRLFYIPPKRDNGFQSTVIHVLFTVACCCKVLFKALLVLLTDFSKNSGDFFPPSIKYFIGTSLHF